MGLFSPHKRHANQFNYKPRYYDPDKEAMEQRRAELRGNSEDSKPEESKPGDMIRARKEARLRRLEASGRGGDKSSKYIKLILLIVGAIALIWLVTSFLETFEAANKQGDNESQEVIDKQEIQQIRERTEFDPDKPLEWIHNDGTPYSEEEIDKFMQIGDE